VGTFFQLLIAVIQGADIAIFAIPVLSLAHPGMAAVLHAAVQTVITSLAVVLLLLAAQVYGFQANASMTVIAWHADAGLPPTNTVRTDIVHGAIQTVFAGTTFVGSAGLASVVRASVQRAYITVIAVFVYRAWQTIRVVSVHQVVAGIIFII